MDTAAFKVKFRPLLKKIQTLNPQLKCCIEIVPELSRVQNLDKIDLKSQNSFVEYKIPITYTIVIKKQETPNGLNNKVYHSCIDLLPVSSQSYTNMESGDIERIKSENAFIALRDKGVEFLSTNTLLANKFACDNSNDQNETAKEPTSMQIIDIFENLSFISSFQPLPDQTFQVDMYKDTFKKDSPVHKSKNFEIQEIHKSNNNANYTTRHLIKDEVPVCACYADACVETFSYLSHSKTTQCDDYTESHSQLCICSVNSCDMSLNDQIQNNTSSNYTTYRDLNMKSIACETVYKTHDAKNVCWKTISNCILESKSRQIIQRYKAETNVKIDTTSSTDNEFIKKIDCLFGLHPKTLRSTGTETFCIRKNSNETRQSQTLPYVKSRHMINKKATTQNYLTNDSNNFDANNLNNLKSMQSLNEPLNRVFGKEDLFKENKFPANFVSNDNNYYKKYPKKVKPPQGLTQAKRVARILKIVDSELGPLKKMLQDIHYKCVTLGLTLCSGEFKPFVQKIAFYKQLPSFGDRVEGSKSKKIERRSSNRGVYSIVFNE